MSADEAGQGSFRERVRQRNALALRLATVFVGILVPLFWALDWYVLPDPRMVWVTGGVRLGCTLYALALLVLGFRSPGWVTRRSLGLTLSISLVVSWSIAAVCWLQGGYESAYYAGLNLVIVGAGFLFVWPLRTALIFNGLTYGFYMLPLGLGMLSINDFLTVLNNQFFLWAMMVISIASQQHRFRLERRELLARLALEQTTTSLEAAYEKLKEVDQAKDQFFSNITHELRTPLTLVISPLEGMLADELGALSADQRSYLKTIHGNALKLLKLINDLLDLARLEERFLRLELRRDDLSGQLRQLVDYARPLAARKQITVEFKVKRKPTELLIDPEKIERVFVNLLANALKFSRAEGRVEISLDSDGEGGVTIAVADTGIGIDEEKLQTIFERFNQSDASVTRNYGGTGIGLAFAREMVELHGGRITVDSELGQGSTFTVHLREGRAHLPEGVTAADARGEEAAQREWTEGLRAREEYRFLDIDAATERRVAQRSDDGGKSTKVLVVEDTVDVLRFINLILSPEHSVYLAQDGRQGLELATRELPDVVITDFMMPEMDGLSLIRALRADERTVETPIIMLTAKKTVEDRQAARREGADVYLPKPFNPGELRAAVQQLLERRGRQTSHLIKAQVRSLETICAGLSHEIKNPLSYIKNSNLVIAEKTHALLELVKKAELSPADAKKVAKIEDRVTRMVAAADTGVEKINRVIDIVRRYSREGYPSELSRLPVDAAIEDIVKLIVPRDNQEVEVALDLRAGDAAVRCVPEEMQQVIGNLSQNAMDAVRTSGTVSIRTRRGDGQVVIEIVDTGSGIAPENLQRIFTPFFSTKDPGKGMGMGLAIVHQVVTGGGGTVSVDSTLGQGTTFRIQLPEAGPTAPPVC